MPEYVFCGKSSFDGSTGEIPEVRLEGGDELPCIGKASSVAINFLHRENLSSSELRFTWKTSGEKQVVIRADCEAKDENDKVLILGTVPRLWTGTIALCLAVMPCECPGK